jgi:hypothetical protein
MPKLLTLLVTTGVVLVATGIVASAAPTNPYTGTGYDISYPQCSSATLPAGSFGIVGVNGGRPFTPNSCFGQELAHASGGAMPAPSIYINTAYSGAYRRNVTPGCAAQAQTMAWQIGCSEADTAFQYAGRPATTAVTMWWLDVETGNSWSSSNVNLNRQTIQGAVDLLNQSGFQVGVYSTQRSWTTITGACATAASCWSPVNSLADWVAGGSCSTPFDPRPVWLTQFTNGFDYDTAC